MKEILKGFKDGEIEIAVEKQQQKEIKLIGSQRKIRGLILWEYNRKEKTLQPAKYKKQDFSIKSLTPSPSELHVSNKVQVNEYCTYFQALNRKNAEKKLKQMEL
jgi:hypothetical protein